MNTHKKGRKKKHNSIIGYIWRNFVFTRTSFLSTIKSNKYLHISHPFS